MPITTQRALHGGQQDHLFHLIKTLTKAEKRNFRLYVTRNQSSDDLKFLHLFDVLDKQKEYEDFSNRHFRNDHFICCI